MTSARSSSDAARPPVAVVLLSGGLDSAAALAWARSDGYACHALTVDYSQRHRAELVAARRLAESLGAIEHTVLPLDLRRFGASALTDDIEVPLDRNETEITRGIPVTYVPARNLIFLSLALARAESLGASDIFIGVNAIDYSGYPDCRPDFIDAFEQVARLATRAGVEGDEITIHAPLIQLTKGEIILRAGALGVDLAQTISCYAPDDEGRACARCDACSLRRRGFDAAGVADVTRYQPGASA